MNGFWWTQREAQTAPITQLEIYHGDLWQGRRALHAPTLAAPVRGVKHQPCLELRFSLA